MKNKKLLRMMSSADDEYVAEADPQKISKRRSAYKKIIIAAVVAAALMLGTLAGTGYAIGAWLFTPFDTSPPDVSEYSDSEYYELIQKINAVSYEQPRYGNNFSAIVNGFSNMFLKGAAKDDAEIEMAPESADGSSGSDVGATYEEITDNQTAGVTEGDRIKRSSEYIYYLDGDFLRVYSIAGEESEEVGSYDLANDGITNYSYYDYREIYLSSDCKTVTVLTPKYDKNEGSFVEILALDVSDAQNITEKKTVRLMGGYSSSRLTGGKFIVISEFYVGRTPDFSDETQFVPQIDSGDGYESIPMEGIISPETLTSTRYTVISSFDEDTLALTDTSAFLSCGEHVYVSGSVIYVTRSYSEVTENSDEAVTQVDMTEIYGMEYGEDEFCYLGSVSVEGSVNDRYSLDEYKGLLRVVTTTRSWSYKQSYNRIYGAMESISVSNVGNGTNANLYCIDFESGEIIAEVIAFAPDGETVQSARFDGDAAYVCTSVELTDPVFFFDLSDLSNITVKDTGTIEGFSSSLVSLGDGYLVGIGVGSSRNTLKIEVYEEDGDGVVSVAKYELESTYNSSDYKSYYINREEQLIGMGVDCYSIPDGDQRYILLHFDGYELRELINVELCGDTSFKRGVYIDGYMYMLGMYEMKVQKIN